MKNFAASTARKTRHVLGSIFTNASMCFSAKTADGDTFKDAREETQTCRISHEIVKADLGKASKVVEQKTHREKQPGSQDLQMVQLTWSVVSLENNWCDPSEFWDTRSADEEIDISDQGVPLAPPRTFRVQNVRFFREKRETDSKRKRFFRHRGKNNPNKRK